MTVSWLVPYVRGAPDVCADLRELAEYLRGWLLATPFPDQVPRGRGPCISGRVCALKGCVDLLHPSWPGTMRHLPSADSIMSTAPVFVFGEPRLTLPDPSL